MPSFEYYVTLVFEYANIGVSVVIDVEDEELAIKSAGDVIAYDGIKYPEPREVNVELVGGFE